jgi:predicted RNA binding protein YcfA (HicA-like mRNA interferase family)
MRRLRPLSGAELLPVLSWVRVHGALAAGSHITLRRTHADGTTLTIPADQEIRLGTLHAIVAQAARFIPVANP